MERNICPVLFVFLGLKGCLWNLRCHAHIVDLVLITYWHLDASKFYCNSSKYTLKYLVVSYPKTYCQGCPSVWQPFLHLTQQHSTWKDTLLQKHSNVCNATRTRQRWRETERKATETDRQDNSLQWIQPETDKTWINIPLNIQVWSNHILHLLQQQQP